ncbi:MAG: cytochrome c3 family protein [Candidatus Aquicultorales bacterium]
MWDEGTASWGAPVNGLPANTTVNYVINKASPTKLENIVGILTTDAGGGSRLYVQRWNGSTWINEWNVGTAASALASRRSYDIAYEESSGDAVLVYSDGTKDPKYRVYDAGTQSWSAQQVITSNRTSGSVWWVELEARPNSQEIALAWEDGNGDLNAYIWNGSSWGTEPGSTLENNVAYAASAGDSKAFDLAYENNGDLLLVFGWNNNTNNRLAARYVVKPADAGWGTVQDFATWADEATVVDLAAEPGGNRIIAVTADSKTQDLQYGVWTGTGWTNLVQNGDTSMNNGGWQQMPIQAGWALTGGVAKAIIVYNDVDSGVINWKSWNGATWINETDWRVSPSNLGNSRAIEIDRQPGENKLMVTVQDVSQDIWAKTYDGSSWVDTEGGAAIDTAASSVYFPFDFEYDRFAMTTAGDGSDPSDKSVAAGSTNVGIDAFTLETNTGVDTVTGLTFAGNAPFNSSNVSNVRLFRDTGAIPNEWDAADTFIASGVLSGTDVTFSGLNSAVDKTTGAQFLIVFDVTPGAGSVDLSGTVSAGTATNTFVDADTAGAAITVNAATTVAGEGSDPSPKVLAKGSSNAAVDAFTLYTSTGSDTVTGLTFTGNADFTSANVTNVRLYRDVGVTPNEWDATDTLIASGTLTGTDVSFSGLGISVADTPGAQYLIVTDIAAGAAGGTNLSGNVSAAVSANPFVDEDNASAMITVLEATTTAADGVDPSDKTSPPGGANLALDAFTLYTNGGGDTVTGVTFAGSEGFTSTNAANVRLFKDTGEVPNEYDAGDTLIATGTLTGTDVVFSGLSIPVDSTPGTQYLVVTDIALGATGAASLSGNVSSVVCANSFADGDATSAVITVSATITGDGVDPADKSVGKGMTNIALDSFTLYTNAGNDTVTGLTFSGNASFTSSNVSNVRVYRDTGATPNEYDAADSLIASGTLSGTSVTFSGLSLSAGTAPGTQYLVVFDVNSGATEGISLSGTISAAVTTNAFSDQDISSATVFIASTFAGNGSDPASRSVGSGVPNVALDAFTLYTNVGNDTVTSLTFAGNTEFTSANVMNVRLFRDTGTTPNEYDSMDTLVASGTHNGTNVEFTGLNLAVGTAPGTQYLVVFDIRPTTGQGTAFSGSVSEGSSGNPFVDQDITGATITVSALQVMVKSQPVARGSVTVGQAYVVMQSLDLRTNSGTTSWTGFTLDEYGSGSAVENILKVRLYKETNGKPGLQGPESQAAVLDTEVPTAPLTFSAETQSFTLSASQAVTQSSSAYYIVYCLAPSSQVSGITLGSRLANQNAISLGGGELVMASTSRFQAQDTGQAEGYVVEGFTNLQSNELGIVASPHSGFGITTNLCETCHSTHMAPSFSNDTQIPQGSLSTHRILNKAYLESPDAVNNFDHKTTNLLCEACHDGTGASTNIKADYEPDGEPALNTEGHQTKSVGSQTTGWKAPPAGKQYNAGVKIPCMTCHDAHGSTKANSKMLADGLYDYAKTAGWVEQTADNKITSGTDEVCRVCHYRTTDAGQTTTVMGNSLQISNAVQDHSSASGCMGCHSKPHNPKASESEGGIQCGGCHASIYESMDAGSTGGYHHYMSNANAPSLSPNTYPTENDRSCTMCHVDHNIFRPDLNGANGATRAKNLRTDIGIQPTLTGGFTDMDFDDSLTNGGICVSCHRSSQTKDVDNRKNDGSTQTPAIAKADFNASRHNYSSGVTSTFTKDGSTFTGNCIKCHNDGLAKQYQNSVLKFGLHDSPYWSLLTNNALALGGTGVNVAVVANPGNNALEENFCYICHSGGAAAGTDIYGNAMSARSEDVKDQFTKASKHPVGEAALSGRHKADEYISATAGSWNVGTSRHVECGDCHEPHVAKTGLHQQGQSTIGAVLTGSWGVALTWPTAWTEPATSAYSKTILGSASEEWQLCLKCHSNFAYGATPPVAPSGGVETNQALEFNPNNAGYHAVAGPSKTSGGTYINGWSADSRMTCSDCHDRSSGLAEGPHGSDNAYLLAAPWSNATGTAGSDGDLCFSCHQRGTYGGNTNNSGTATGFSTGSKNLHNVGQHRVACVSCHSGVPHGWHKYRLLVEVSDPAPYNSGSQLIVNTWRTSGNWAKNDCAGCH